MYRFVCQNFKIRTLVAILAVICIVPLQLSIFKSIRGFAFYPLVCASALAFLWIYWIITKGIFTFEVSLTIYDQDFVFKQGESEERFLFSDISSVIYIRRRFFNEVFCIFFVKTSTYKKKYITGSISKSDFTTHPLSHLYHIIQSKTKLSQTEYSTTHDYWELR